MEKIVLAISDPLLRRAATAELMRDYDLLIGYGHEHSVALLLGCPDPSAVVVQGRAWSGGDADDLLAEARRWRPDAGRTMIVPLMLRGGGHEGGAHAICRAPWEAGQLTAAVRRAVAAGRAAAAGRLRVEAHPS